MKEHKEQIPPRTKALTVTELERVNAVSCFKAGRVADKIASALRISGDADKEKRLAARMCRGCFYVDMHCSGQAFTEWQCLLCSRQDVHPNTATPQLCNTCSDVFRLCASCGGDLDMQRRTKFDRKAKKLRKAKA